MFKGTEALLCGSSSEGAQKPFYLPPTVVFLFLCFKTLPLTGRLLFSICNAPSVLRNHPGAPGGWQAVVWGQLGAAESSVDRGVAGCLAFLCFLCPRCRLPLECREQAILLLRSCSVLPGAETVPHFLGRGLRP